MTLVVAAAAVLGAAASGALPCDIFATHGTPCVAAHSVVRALYADYDGPLYQVVRTADGESVNVTTLGRGGYADVAAQESLCAAAPEPQQPHAAWPWAPGPCCDVFRDQNCPDNCDKKSPGACPSNPGCVGCADCGAPSRQPALATCMMSRIFDQSAQGNHLHVTGHPDGLGAVAKGGRLFAGAQATGTNASADPLRVDGHRVYSAYFEGGMGFRTNTTRGIPTGDEPETIYMVASGQHYNDHCCFDYGNAEIGTWPNTTNNLTFARGLMECAYVGNGYGYSDGPHVLADLEMGVYGGGPGGVNGSYTGINASFITAMVKGDSGNHWAIKWGDAQGGPLHTAFDGERPSAAYTPMKKPGGLVLGLGGDTSNGGVGTFYEGVVTRGYTSDAADDAVQANIVSARYGQ